MILHKSSLTPSLPLPVLTMGYCPPLSVPHCFYVDVTCDKTSLFCTLTTAKLISTIAAILTKTTTTSRTTKIILRQILRIIKQLPLVQYKILPKIQKKMTKTGFIFFWNAYML